MPKRGISVALIIVLVFTLNSTKQVKVYSQNNLDCVKNTWQQNIDYLLTVTAIQNIFLNIGHSIFFCFFLSFKNKFILREIVSWHQVGFKLWPDEKKSCTLTNLPPPWPGKFSTQFKLKTSKFMPNFPCLSCWST